VVEEAEVEKYNAMSPAGRRSDSIHEIPARGSEKVFLGCAHYYLLYPIIYPTIPINILLQRRPASSTIVIRCLCLPDTTTFQSVSQGREVL
jgi:glutamate racemase